METNTNELVKIEKDNLVINKDAEKIIEFIRLEKEMKYQELLLKQAFEESMTKLGIKNYKYKDFSVTLRDGSTKTIIDSKRLKEELPDIYKSYTKESVSKPSVTMTISDND